jgi:hypothetical protein
VAFDLDAVLLAIEPIDRDAANGWNQNTHHDADGCGLAGTVGAEETECLAFSDRENEIAHGGELAVVLAQVVERDHGCAAGKIERIMPATASAFQDLSVSARIEVAARAAASLLLDLMRVDGAIEMRQRLEHRAGGAVLRHTDLADGSKQFVGASPFQLDGVGSERQGAGMGRDIDIAGAADNFVGFDGNRLVGRKREGENAVQETRHDGFFPRGNQR